MTSIKTNGPKDIPPGYVPLAGGLIQKGDLFWSSTDKEWRDVKLNVGARASSFSNARIRKVATVETSLICTCGWEGTEDQLVDMSFNEDWGESERNCCPNCGMSDGFADQLKITKPPQINNDRPQTEFDAW